MDHRTPTQHQNLQPPHTRPITTPESIPGLPVTTIHHTPPLPPIPSCTGPPAGHTKHLSQPPGAPPPIQSKQTLGNGQTGKLDKYIFGRGGPHHPISEPGQNNPTSKLHKQWLESQENHTIIIYTDGSKLDNGSTGCGWAIYHCGDQHLYRLDEGSCHLGSRAEVYDAELHAVQEAVATLLTTTAPRGTVIICSDNQAAMATLNFNKHNYKYARWALDSIEDLRTLGWQVSITWCPSHCNIRGNERANTLAK